MNILFAFSPNTIPAVLIHPKVNIVEHHVGTVTHDTPTLAWDLALDAPASTPQVPVDSDGFFWIDLKVHGAWLRLESV